MSGMDAIAGGPVTRSSSRQTPLLRRCERGRKSTASLNAKLRVCGTQQRYLRRKRQRAANVPISSKSDSPISDISDNLLIHILQRLPDPRSVCVCKSVCKHWNFLISDPGTLRQLVSRHKINPTDEGQRSMLIYFDRPETHGSILRNFPNFFSNGNGRRHIQVISCSNDLLLCGRIRPKNRYGRKFFVCNPFTKHCVALPLVPTRPTLFEGLYFGTHRFQGVLEHDASLIGFACEPCFYYDDRSCSSCLVTQQNPNFRFRVVFLFRGDTLSVTTFCSESWEWKFSSLGVRPLSVELPFLPSTAPYIGVSNAHSTSLAGKLFWKTTGAQVAVYDPFSDQRLPFKLIDCSHLWSNDIANNNFLIGVSQGYLRGMVFPRPGRVHSKGFFHCWKLEEDKSVVGGYRWSFDYNVSMRMVYNIIVPQLKLNKIGGRRRRMRLGVLGVHPSKPEVIYFECHDHSKKHNHDPFFFDFRHHFRVNDGSPKPDHNYDPIYVVPFDVLRHKVVGEIIPIAESNETHLRFKMWGMFGVDDPIGWAVFQPAIPFWPTPIPVPDFANEVAEEEPEDVDESHMYENAFRYLVW